MIWILKHGDEDETTCEDPSSGLIIVLSTQHGTTAAPTV